MIRPHDNVEFFSADNPLLYLYSNIILCVINGLCWLTIGFSAASDKEFCEQFTIGIIIPLCFIIVFSLVLFLLKVLSYTSYMTYKSIDDETLAIWRSEDNLVLGKHIMIRYKDPNVVINKILNGILVMSQMSIVIFLVIALIYSSSNC